MATSVMSAGVAPPGRARWISRHRSEIPRRFVVAAPLPRRSVRPDQRNREHLVRYHHNALTRLGLQVTITHPDDGTPPPPSSPGQAALTGTALHRPATQPAAPALPHAKLRSPSFVCGRSRYVIATPSEVGNYKIADIVTGRFAQRVSLPVRRSAGCTGWFGSDRETPILTGRSHATGTAASSSRTTGSPGRLAIGPASFDCSWVHELVAVRGRCCTSVLYRHGPLPAGCRRFYRPSPVDAARSP